MMVVNMRKDIRFYYLSTFHVIELQILLFENYNDSDKQTNKPKNIKKVQFRPSVIVNFFLRWNKLFRIEKKE